MEAMELTSDGPCKLTFESLQRMTNNFSDERKLGCGAFGDVYKGVLADGEEIAVKRLHSSLMPEVDHKQFQNEFAHLKRCRQENIVRLLGFCDETEETVAQHNGRRVICDRIHRAICLEYMPNGSLAKLLSDKYNRKNWPLRYRIIKGTGEGLKYLHEELEEPILHLDLKPDNILLDQQMVPKIADFGISRLVGERNTKSTMSYLGTRGYSPPEFINCGIISKEFDIFSFGVVTMKIIFGVEGYSSIADTNIENPEFIDHAYNYYCRSLLQETQEYAFVESECKQVRGCIEIAVSCMDKDRRKRPKIKDIARRFEETDFFSSLQQHPGTMPVFSNIQAIHMQQVTMAEALQSQHDQQQSMVCLELLSQNNALQHSQHNIVLSQPIQLQSLFQMLEQRTLDIASTLETNINPQSQYSQAQRGLQEDSSSTLTVQGEEADIRDYLALAWELNRTQHRQLIRVLDLEETTGLTHSDLNIICTLWHLKYLHLGHGITRLPKEMAELKNLMTLAMSKTLVTSIPVEVIGLPCLTNLIGKFKLSDQDRTSSSELERLFKIIELEQVFRKSKLVTLAGFIADGVQVQGFLQLMVHMKNLTKVKIWCELTDVGDLNILNIDLVKAIQQYTRGQMHNGYARSMSIHFERLPQGSLHALQDVYYHGNSLKEKYYLTSLKLHGDLSKAHDFVATLSDLTHICLSSTTMPRGLLLILSAMPYLLYLTLITNEIHDFFIKVGAFQSLKHLRLVVQHENPELPEIEEGALPELVSLQVPCKHLDGHSGKIRNIRNLQEIELHPEISSKARQEWEAAASNHPNRPKVHFASH